MNHGTMTKAAHISTPTGRLQVLYLITMWQHSSTSHLKRRDNTPALPSTRHSETWWKTMPLDLTALLAASQMITSLPCNETRRASCVTLVVLSTVHIALALGDSGRSLGLSL
jgi:hypothetical protein